jgi:cytochrome c oxidase subunit 4
MADNSNAYSELKQRHEKEKEKRELRYHFVSFAMMVLLTILAFVTVVSESVSGNFATLFIILLACIQVAFQLYYFMHLKDKGHGSPAFFISNGIFVAVLTVATLITLIW